MYNRNYIYCRSHVKAPGDFSAVGAAPGPVIAEAGELRAVPHPVPALGIEGSMRNDSSGGGVRRDAVGAHELLFGGHEASDPGLLAFAAERIFTLLMGDEVVATLDELMSLRVTGRSARLMMRFFGEILIHRRNPYLYQELVDSGRRRRRLFGNAGRDLDIIEANADKFVAEMKGHATKVIVPEKGKAVTV